jgi:hypothetical protein
VIIKAEKKQAASVFFPPQEGNEAALTCHKLECHGKPILSEQMESEQEKRNKQQGGDH